MVMLETYKCHQEGSPNCENGIRLDEKVKEEDAKMLIKMKLLGGKNWGLHKDYKWGAQFQFQDLISCPTLDSEQDKKKNYEISAKWIFEFQLFNLEGYYYYFLS